MWFSLFLVAFLFGAVYFQAIQGLTSAAITCVLSILCLAMAFGTYQYVAQNLLMGVKPEIAYALALFGTFLIPFGVLKLVLDKWIPRGNLFPQLADRVVAAGFGLVAAFVVTGVMALCVGMVPWGQEGFISYQRFNVDKPEAQNELWLKPDRFAVYLAESLSDGSFNGSQSFAVQHPDLVSELGWIASIPRGVRTVVPANAIEFREAKRIPFIYERIEDRNRRGGANTATYNEKEPSPGNVFTLVTLSLNADAADDDKRHRFTPACVRLVGHNGGEPAEYGGIAAGDKDEPHRQIGWLKKGNEDMKPAAGILMTCPPNNQIDIVFEHPRGFEPQFVDYKLGGHAAISKSDISTAATSAQAAATPATPPPENENTSSTSGQSASTRGGGRIAGVRFQSSFFGDKLPLTLTAYTARDIETRGDALVQGHLEGSLADQGTEQRDHQVSSLVVPSGYGLLHMNVEKLQAKSMYGRVLDFSRSTVENYLVEDDHGKQYQAVGKYAVANVGGQPYVELLYFPEYAQSGGRWGTFDKIKRTHLKGDYQLVYLYLIDKGAKVVRFTTGGNAHPVDLSSENLVAR